MHELNKILVVYNDTEDCATLAGQLGVLLGKTGADLTLMKVIGEVPERPIMAMPPGDLAELVIARHRSELEAVAAALGKDQLRASVKVVTGKPLREIAREALASGYDLIVKTSERRHGDRRPSSRGLDQRLLRTCPHSLLLLGQTIPPRLRNVMVAVDLEQPRSGKYDLARKLLETSQRISQSTSATLHVFHAWQAPAEDSVRNRLGATMANQYVNDIRNGQWRRLTDTLHRANVSASNIRFHFEKGVAKQLLPQIVRDEDIDLLVIGTVGRSGLSGSFFGNTSEAILREIEIPVLTVKPDSFVSVFRVEAGDLKSGDAQSKSSTGTLPRTGIPAGSERPDGTKRRTIRSRKSPAVPRAARSTSVVG